MQEEYYTIDAQNEYQPPLNISKTLLNIASMFQDTKMVVESKNQHFYSRMAMSSYFHHDQRVVKKLFDNYQFDDIQSYHLDERLSTHEHSVFHSPQAAHTVVSFRGTASQRDVGTDLLIFTSLEKESRRMERSEILMDQVFQEYGRNVTTTGHSLGGNLAQEMALEHDLEAHVFNAATSLRQAKNLKTSNQITSYRTHGDLVSTLAESNDVVRVNPRIDLSADIISQHKLENFYDRRATVKDDAFLIEKSSLIHQGAAYASHLLNGVQMVFGIDDMVHAIKTHEDTEVYTDKISQDLSVFGGMNLDPEFTYNDTNVSGLMQHLTSILKPHDRVLEDKLANLGEQKSNIYTQVDDSTLTRGGVTYREVPN